MGLVSTGVSLLSRAGTFLGGLFGRGATAVAGGGALARVGRAAIGPFGQSLAGGALGAAAITGFGGDGQVGAPGGAGIAGGSQLAAIVAGGGQPTPLAGGRFLVTAPNGDVQIFNRNGMAVRPQLIIPAGQRLPGGAVVVSTRQGGALIGITKRRARRAFSTEVRRVRRTIQGCRAVLSAAEKPKRRS